MLHSRSWRLGTTLLLTLGMMSTVVTPILISPPAIAQYAPGYSNAEIIPAGTLIPVEYDQAEKVILTPDESFSITLFVSRDVFSSNGTLLIPAWSQVQGTLRPVQGGTQFIARTLVFRDGRRTALNANSQVVDRTAKINESTSRSIFRGAVIGAAAATLISAITGDRAIATEEVLRGAGLGALAGIILQKDEGEVVVIYPNEDLDLTVRSDVVLPYRG